MSKEGRRLKIVGTDINLVIRGCSECPLFYSGAGFEYHAQCSLTYESGDPIYDDYHNYNDAPSIILSKCPLPKVKL